MGENILHQDELPVLTGMFNDGHYRDLIIRCEKRLSETTETQGPVRGKLFLLLGAAYEMSGNKDKAVENYLLGDLLLEKPEVEGVELKKLKVFNSTIFGSVIAGKRVIEKVGKRKKKKKFPILAVIGAAAIIAAVLILFKKKTQEDPGDLRKIYAVEVLNEIEWIEIPSGEFLMGDHTGNGEPHERPVHTVYLDSYRISKYEITLAQFAKYSKVNPLHNATFSGRSDNHPVTGISSHEAHLFCEWLSEENNASIVLPTEAQWEKAARGTDQRIYPWGNSDPSCSIVNFIHCMAGVSVPGAYPGDRSFYGVMDMGGNVSEWVSDIYQDDYYSVSPYSNPTGPDFGDESFKILRGGNFASDNCSATRRQLHRRTSGTSFTGIRIVFR